MSSSDRNVLHRRRSHSASSPLTSIRQFTGDKWRRSYKRARPSSICDHIQKDLPYDGLSEGRKDGKRARRDSASLVMSSRAPCILGSGPAPNDVWTSKSSPFSPAHLPHTSDAFSLFPSRCSSTGASYCASQKTPPPASSACSAETPDVLTHLRSTAFWELQRSVAENGEGMVTRMRDWEETHAHPSLKHQECDAPMYGQHNRMRGLSVGSGNSDSFDEDEDEVQIIEAGSSSRNKALFQPILFSHRNTTAGRMDLDDQGSPLVTDGPTPLDDSPCLSSSYASDEDFPGSLALTGSLSSSRASLSFHSDDAMPGPGGHPLSTSSVTLATSPSEKAIAALTLVMANGAGSLSDYEAVRSLEVPHVASLDGPLVGEMWD
ncbi:hypothetical protein BDY19DRAFT_988444 [Irpex rosettiformis]|uniref:Uncharacterized protein n=1 Tax=Irpex rosettiformis TaxID=378272 RepID=A0ACB8UJZ1_9APHY|nr:hypothetical protein BDY19DRAFT_988444 [Irpex rosettiformis]